MRSAVLAPLLLSLVTLPTDAAALARGKVLVKAIERDRLGNEVKRNYEDGVLSKVKRVTADSWYCYWYNICPDGTGPDGSGTSLVATGGDTNANDHGELPDFLKKLYESASANRIYATSSASSPGPSAVVQNMAADDEVSSGVQHQEGELPDEVKALMESASANQVMPSASISGDNGAPTSAVNVAPSAVVSQISNQDSQQGVELPDYLKALFESASKNRVLATSTAALDSSPSAAAQPSAALSQISAAPSAAGNGDVLPAWLQAMSQSGGVVSAMPTVSSIPAVSAIAGNTDGGDNWNGFSSFDWTAWNGWGWWSYSVDYVKEWYYETYGTTLPSGVSDWSQLSAFISHYGTPPAQQTVSPTVSVYTSGGAVPLVAPTGLAARAEITPAPLA